MNRYCKYCYKDTRTPIEKTPRGISKLKLVLLDMDGVLTDAISSWRFIHEYFGVSNDESVELYIRGEIDDQEFIRRDVSLWRENNKLITLNKLEEILSKIPLRPGGKTLVEELHTHGVETAIVSAGLDILAHRVAKTFNIDYVYANGIKTQDGRLTGDGIVVVQLMYKDKAVERISRDLNIDFKEMIGVGDSCFDIPMLQKCGLGIAFNPLDECIEETADIVVRNRNLTSLIPILNQYL
ncbi:MAG TPA: HAD family hydrolase [Thermoplasmatales archaeon]|nr:HAD family hydrolase [Thermoplasmatales archaeon]